MAGTVEKVVDVTGTHLCGLLMAIVWVLGGGLNGDGAREKRRWAYQIPRTCGERQWLGGGGDGRDGTVDVADALVEELQRQVSPPVAAKRLVEKSLERIHRGIHTQNLKP